jgi:hypothetical protein
MKNLIPLRGSVLVVPRGDVRTRPRRLEVVGTDGTDFLVVDTSRTGWAEPCWLRDVPGPGEARALSFDPGRMTLAAVAGWWAEVEPPDGKEPVWMPIVGWLVEGENRGGEPIVVDPDDGLPRPVSESGLVFDRGGRFVDSVYDPVPERAGR